LAFDDPKPADYWLHGAAAWFLRRAGLARCTTIAGVAGLCLAAFFPGRFLVAIAGLTLALGCILAGHVFSRWRPGSSLGLGVVLVSVVLVGLLAGLLVGTLRISSLLDGVLSSRIGERVRAEVVITGPVRSSSGWHSATAVVRAIGGGEGMAPSPGGPGAGDKVLLEVAPLHDGGQESVNAPLFRQGSVLAVTGSLRAPKGPSASGFDQARQLLHQGVQVILRVEPRDLSLQGQRGGVSGWFDHLREGAKEHLSLGPDARVNEVLQGVVMGDTAGIDQGWMDSFRRSGTAHMLSVSGLHVASLAAIVIAIAGLARLSRRAGFVLAATAALLMVPFVGSSPPILRSAAMIVVVLAGRWVGRRRDQWQGLAFAALVVLVLNPFAVFDVGFQLSFSAFAGMLALVRPIERLLRRLPDSIRANLAVSLAATLGTSPVSLLVFGRTSLISPVANLLVVPTLASVTGLGMASALLGFLWSGFSVALDTLASLPMSWTILVSTLCGQAPVLNAESTGRLLFAAGLAAAALPAALALSGHVVAPPLRLRPPGFRRSLCWLKSRRPRSRGLAAAAGIAVVAGALLVGAAVYPAAAAGVRSVQLLAGGQRWPAQVEVRLLDVGQGTAVLLRTPQHRAALFDGGPAGCDLAGQLRALGVKRLDLVVVSHPHADHFAGLLEGLDSLEVRTFVDSTEIVDQGGSALPSRSGTPAAGGMDVTAAGNTGITGRGPFIRTPGEENAGGEAGQYVQLRDLLADSGCRTLGASLGSSLTLDDVRIEFFAPRDPLTLHSGGEPWGEGRDPPTGDELNGRSLVTLLTVGDATVLLPGDAEADALEAYDLPKLSAIVVPHHGSRGALSPALLAILEGRLALISVGKGNGFGHPDPGVVGMLEAAGDSVVRTDEYGWVSLRLMGTQMIVSSERTPGG
jgi:competence protein ComEC